MISADRNFSASHSNSGDSCKVKLRPPTGLCYHWANPQMPNADPTYQPWLLALWEACVLMTRILKIPHEVHPVLMLIGYIILGSEAIMIYKVFPKLNHDTAKLTHLILHAIATVLGAFAIYCVFKYHNDSGIANLYSLHSWLGIGTISLYGIQWVFGFVTFFPGVAPSVWRSALPWHTLFRLFVYVLALATAELGLLESGGLDKYGTEAFLVNFTALVVVLFGASVVVTAVTPAHVEEPRGYAPIPVN